jgi:hypothetical protein
MPWRDTERTDHITVEMIDPKDPDSVRGELEGVILRGSSLTQGYYTDTRIGGRMSVMGHSYIENSMLRITHRVDAWNYEKELGTFISLSGEGAYEHGVRTTDHVLKSALYGLEVDKWTWNYVVSAGTYCKAALDAMLASLARPHRILSTVRDTRINTATVYLFGTGCLSSVYDLCNACDARLGVDGHGIVTVEPYVNPANLTPLWHFDLDRGDEMIIGEVIVSGRTGDAPGRVGVIWKSGNSEIYARADAPSTSPAHPGRRGYTKVDIHQLTEMSPQSQWQAQTLADRYLSESPYAEVTGFSFMSRYVPLDQGSAASVKFGGITYKCLVKEVDLDFMPGMPIQLDLKVV